MERSWVARRREWFSPVSDTQNGLNVTIPQRDRSGPSMSNDSHVLPAQNVSASQLGQNVSTLPVTPTGPHRRRLQSVSADGPSGQDGRVRGFIEPNTRVNESLVHTGQDGANGSFGLVDLFNDPQTVSPMVAEVGDGASALLQPLVINVPDLASPTIVHTSRRSNRPRNVRLFAICLTLGYKSTFSTINAA
jgi:hypothetical protein